jgi:predicted SnoaL-like aldol condensation-catalyzing enzyme
MHERRAEAHLLLRDVRSIGHLQRGEPLRGISFDQSNTAAPTRGADPAGLLLQEVPPVSTIAATNTEVALEFLRLAATGHAREAMERFASPDFVHHNPWFPHDAASLAAAMDENARANPGKRLEVQRAISEGDLVAVHSRVQHAPDGPEAATVHLFRISDGLIHELWDVGQEAPAESPNRRGMF